MHPLVEQYDTKSEDIDARRRHFVEAKVKQKDQEPTATAKECERLLGYLNKVEVSQPGCRILDSGCGTGRLAVCLAERGYEAYGIDVNPDFIEVARDKAKAQGVSAYFMTAEAEQLPFDDEFFDICIVFHVLEHVVDWKKTIDEVARILKPGGIALFETNNALYPFPREVKYIPCLGYVPHKLRKKIIDMIALRFPKLVEYSLTPAIYWFTHTGLRKVVSAVGFKQSWDIFDLTNKQEIPPKLRWVSWLLPIVKKLPYPYIRDIAHFPRSGVMLICKKA